MENANEYLREPSNLTNGFATAEQTANANAAAGWQKAVDLNVMLTIVYLAIFLIGVIGNICNCLVIADSRNRYMKTATNYYLFSLSISDLLLLIFGLPHDVVILWHPQPYLFGEFVCISRGWISEASTYASVLVIVAFTVERYLAICHPLKAHTLSRLSRSIKIIVLIWLVASSCALIVVLQYGLVLTTDKLADGSEVIIGPQCTTVRRNERIFELSVLIFFIIPMAVITILYVKLGYILRQKTSLIKKSRDQKRERLCDLAQAAACENLNNKQRQQQQQQQQNHHLLLAPSNAAVTRSELQLCSRAQESSVVTCPVVLAGTTNCWTSVEMKINCSPAAGHPTAAAAASRINKKRLSISCDPIEHFKGGANQERWLSNGEREQKSTAVAAPGTNESKMNDALSSVNSSSSSLATTTANLGHSQGAREELVQNQQVKETSLVVKNGPTTRTAETPNDSSNHHEQSNSLELDTRTTDRDTPKCQSSTSGGSPPASASTFQGRGRQQNAAKSKMQCEDKVSQSEQLKLSSASQQVGGFNLNSNSSQKPNHRPLAAAAAAAARSTSVLASPAAAAATKRKEGVGAGGGGGGQSSCNSSLKQYPFALHSTVNTANMHSVIKMLVSVVVMFFICWAPFHAQRLMAIYVNNPTREQEFIFSLLNHISGVSYYISAVVNPILYSLFSVKFRQAFRNTFGSLRPNVGRAKGNRTHLANSGQANNNHHPNTTEAHLTG